MVTRIAHYRRAVANPLRALQGQALVAIVAALFLVCSACGDGDGEVVAEDGAEPTQVGSDEGPGVITFIDGRFDPDFLEVVQGGTVTVENGTDSAIAVMVSGTNVEDSEVRELEPGATFQLQLNVLGAQVLTLSDDPNATGSIMVIAEEAGQ